ncbi:hypothetical protein F4560_000025 [Saccharothrix ecbatanensis]|uniref:HEAT repeat domain-containing protein n=1 Tax=Saccharothrix ecbatanensis TaxID=1105145 RepID=A0A7W9HDH4_9PSEU|nr:hypothetical protein [Saccharothrix ecbatanensis]MBB5800257.1 hypothetical protein [Saccharothrix ecbatanensis]
MTEHDRFPEFVAATGLQDVDVNVGVHDEHVRHEVYLRALADATPPDDLQVITRVLGDPDQVMAVSAVVRHLDRLGESHPDFDTWAEAVLPVLGGREFPTRRVAEWLLYRDLVAGGEPDRDRLREASDWLQRKVADNLTRPSVLEVLAEVGRTKRVRNTAKSKIR